MDHLFLSDVHIGAFSPEEDQKIQSDLMSLVRYCSAQNIKIHILGDLFDYWMEYRSWHPSHGDEVLRCFRDYMREIGPVNYITGNHDNWTNGHFNSLGFNIVHEYIDFTEGSNRFFLHHGDGLSDSTLNLKRPLLHRFLRNKMFVKLYQILLPPKFGMKAMQAFSNLSKKRAYCDPTILDQWSEEFLEKSKADYVISGHDHHPRKRVYINGTYVNLGTFFDDRTVALYTKNQLDLVIWDADSMALMPFDNMLKTAVNS